MATKANLMGLGMPHHLAARVGRTPTLVTAEGTTLATAHVIGGTEYDVVVNSGSGGVVLRSPASADGRLMGDIFWVTNYLASAIALYTRNATVIFSAVSVSGSVGFSVQPGQTFGMQPITATTWRVLAIAATSVTAA